MSRLGSFREDEKVFAASPPPPGYQEDVPVFDKRLGCLLGWQCRFWGVRQIEQTFKPCSIQTVILGVSPEISWA